MKRTHPLSSLSLSILLLCCFLCAQAQQTDSIPDTAGRPMVQPQALVVPMALPAVPHITYSVPTNLPTGTAVNYLPTNTGGAVYADGDVTTLAGSGTAAFANGTGTAASFNYPIGMVTDASGNLYVADARNYRIRKVTPGGVVTTFAGSGTAGSADGTGAAASLNGSSGLAIDGSGNLYFTDRSNFKVRKISPSGVVTTLAGAGVRGYAEGTGTAAKFDALSGIAVDAAGNIYVADEGNHRIRKITSAGVVTTFAGSGTTGNTDGTGTAAQFMYPKGMVRDASGNFYIADYGGGRIRKITSAGVVTTLVSISNPFSTAVDASGNILVTLLGNIIKKITPAGVVSTYAGTGSAGSQNGSPLSALVNAPEGIWVSANGTVYIGDTGNNLIRKMGTGQGYSISPALPAGMSFNKTTGAITGTPTASSSTTTYTITAYNAGGTGTATVSFAVSGGAFSADQNYIHTTTYLNPFTSEQANPATTDAMQDVQYFDGLGRPLQTVGVKAAPAATKDIVTPIAYDAYGREDKQYLPYATATGVGGAFKTTGLASQAYYYNNAPPVGQAKNPYPFSQTVYEPSPLNRVQQQGFPGTAWQPKNSVSGSGHTARTEYTTNNSIGSTDPANMRIASLYGVSLSSSGVPTLTLSGTYASNQLYVTISKDENWDSTATGFNKRLHTAEEYKDKEGKVILKRTFSLDGSTPQVLSTYYVYDDFGNLTYVLPPGINPDRGSTLPSANEITGYGYQYRYDGRNRMSYKRLPGTATWETFNYNQLDQLVFHQDCRQQLESFSGFTPGKYHTFYKYDALGRQIMTGVEKRVTASRDQIDTIIQNWSVLWEQRTNAGGSHHGYTRQSIPTDTSNMEVQEVNYYDSYENIPGLPNNLSASYSKMTQGLLVATKVKVLGTTGTYLWTVNYYNDRGELVRQYKQHYKGALSSKYNYDDFTNSYDFRGKLTKSIRKHNIPNSAGTAASLQVTVTSENVYDHRERLIHVWRTTSPGTGTVGTRTLMARNFYNEVGQLMTKKLHSLDGNTYGQVINYKYNPRGWLSTDSSSLFYQKLFYTEGTTKQYNGNIAYQQYRQGPTGSVQTYGYQYDPLNRLVKGALSGDNYRENVGYTNMGNIRALRRSKGSNAQTDSLNYTYSYNKLTSVADLSTDNTAGYHAPGTVNYLYDGNGNLIRRKHSNAGITAGNLDTITYNNINLPRIVKTPAGQLTYTYDASGRKLRTVFGSTATDYIDGIEWEGSKLNFIQTEEGRAVNTVSNGYAYEYFLKDHLGNTRSGFSADAPTTAKFVSNYYPYGSSFGQGVVTTPKNRYFYNGKELQDGSNLYDYGARSYDPVIGRWNAVDPLAEAINSLSPYQYVQNNPILRIDPNGAWDDYYYDSSSDLQYVVENDMPDRFFVQDDNGDYSQADFNSLSNGMQQSYNTVSSGLNNGTYSFSGGILSVANQGKNENNTLNTTSDIFGAASIGLTAKTELLDWVVRSSYRSNNTRRGWEALSDAQKAWRTTRTLGKAGAKYLKFTKGLGVAGEVVGVAYAGYKVINNPTAGNTTRLIVQGAAIGAAFIPVVGWGISAGIGAIDLFWGDDIYNAIDGN